MSSKLFRREIGREKVRRPLPRPSLVLSSRPSRARLSPFLPLRTPATQAKSTMSMFQDHCRNVLKMEIEKSHDTQRNKSLKLKLSITYAIECNINFTSGTAYE